MGRSISSISIRHSIPKPAFGFYESLGTTIFLKLQILTIKGLLDGTHTARYADLTRGGLTFKKAKKEKAEEQLTLGCDDVAF